MAKDYYKYILSLLFQGLGSWKAAQYQLRTSSISWSRTLLTSSVVVSLTGYLGTPSVSVKIPTCLTRLLAGVTSSYTPVKRNQAGYSPSSSSKPRLQRQRQRLSRVGHVRIQGGGAGGPDPPENHKNIGFLSNTGPDPLATKPAFNVGPTLAGR